MSMLVNKKALESDVNLTEDEKSLIVWIVSTASNHSGASNGEITAYRFLMSLTSNDTVCLNDVLYHLETGKICQLLQMQSSCCDISNFWYKRH